MLEQDVGGVTSFERGLVGVLSQRQVDTSKSCGAVRCASLRPSRVYPDVEARSRSTRCRRPCLLVVPAVATTQLRCLAVVRSGAIASCFCQLRRESSRDRSRLLASRHAMPQRDADRRNRSHHEEGSQTVAGVFEQLRHFLRAMNLNLALVLFRFCRLCRGSRLVWQIANPARKIE